FDRTVGRHDRVSPVGSEKMAVTLIVALVGAIIEDLPWIVTGIVSFLVDEIWQIIQARVQLLTILIGVLP
ncbi:hypothetical protein ACTOVL_08425, partial [Arcanobacterium canis]